jgi:hypothetical protein
MMHGQKTIKFVVLLFDCKLQEIVINGPRDLCILNHFAYGRAIIIVMSDNPHILV